MKLGLKQIYYLDSFNKVKTALEENGKSLKYNLVEYLSYLNEYLSFNKMKKEQLNLILNSEIYLINDNLNDDDKKYKLLIELFSNKILTMENENENEESNNEKEENEINIHVSVNNYTDNNNVNEVKDNINDENIKISLKIILLNKILENPKLIMKSKNFIQLLLKKSNIVPEYSNEKNDNIKLNYLNEYPKISKVNYKIWNILNQTENNFLDEILFQLFETLIYSFFVERKIPKEKISGIIIDYFIKSFNFLQNEQFKIQKSNKSIFLYHIAIIKCFCYEFANIILNYNRDLRNEIDFFNKFLFSNNNIPFIKVVKIYILKSLYLIHYNNFNNLNL